MDGYGLVSYGYFLASMTKVPAQRETFARASKLRRCVTSVALIVMMKFVILTCHIALTLTLIAMY